ncbi:class I SAM-dependent methyltransferase [Embleya scabrispora]|uniref:class I SAM-dependent methyltransferase n=1 Tax=Embleya scabrispora TaxID=159449 RepID=UPI0019128E33|nr:class I SAM-dependent methyltransferase [Embleya scabrispora]
MGVVRESLGGEHLAVLAREDVDRPRPLGRALDLGRGRGRFTPELARRGRQAVGVDYVPAAIEAARQRGDEGVTYVVGDVTDLRSTELGTFDLFLDIGCFQGFDADQRQAVGRGVTAGLGRPMNRTKPQWFRLRRRS